MKYGPFVITLFSWWKKQEVSETFNELTEERAKYMALLRHGDHSRIIRVETSQEWAERRFAEAVSKAKAQG